MKVPSEAELAGAAVFVQRPGVPVPIDAEWYVVPDGRVLVRFRETGGWEESMFDAAAVTNPAGGWIAREVATP